MSNVVEKTLLLVRRVELISSDLTGPEKKTLVLNTLLEIASRIADEEDPEESQLRIKLESVIKSVLPGVIDALIDADKSGIHLRSRCW